MTDNFLMMFDDTSSAVIGLLTTNKKPAVHLTQFHTSDGGCLSIQSIAVADIDTTKLFWGLIPFANIANLFQDENDFTLVNADTHNPGVGEDGTVIRFDAQNEEAYVDFVAGTDLPAGRYYAYARVYGVGGTQDYNVSVKNNTDNKHRSQENDDITKTAPNASWAYQGVIFDITDQDVTDGDTIRLRVWQPNAAPNTVYLDYEVKFFIGDGESGPQDLAHSVLRTVDKFRCISER